MLPVFEFVLKDASSADERYIFCGHSFGTQFASVIVAYFAAKEGVTNMLRIRNMSDGAELCDDFLSPHEHRSHPLALSELCWLVPGSGMAFDASEQLGIVVSCVRGGLLLTQRPYDRDSLPQSSCRTHRRRS